MTDLRIVDAPVLLQESITDDVKMPTGGLGNFSIRLGDIVWYVVTKEQLANKNYVDLSSKGVKDSLNVHIANKANPHNVTKAQVGLGNVDNTADIDKPVSNATKSAIIAATADMATKAYVDLSSKGVKDSLDVHIADKANPHNVTKEQVGLGNVDNTADIDKPVSNATKSAIIAATAGLAAKTYVNDEINSLLGDLKTRALVGLTAFTTKALLLANTTLADNAFAFVVNDTDSNNGLYQKINGVWIYLSYNNAQKINELSDTVNRQEGTFFYSADGTTLTKTSHDGLFAVELNVKPNDVYAFKNQSFGIAGRYYITDTDNTILDSKPSNYPGDARILTMPANAAKLIVNVANTYADKFSLVKIPQITRDLYENSEHDSFFTDIAPTFSQTVTKNGESVTITFDNKCRVMGTNGQAFYLFPQAETNRTITLAPWEVAYVDRILDSKQFTETPYLTTDDIKKTSIVDALDFTNKTVLAINQLGTLLNYGAIGHKYYDDLTKSIPTIDSRLKTVEASKSGVRAVFPQFNYFDKLRTKCPSFYQKFKDKNKDVVVVLSGTSLTQGNLYATDRADATTRPPALHTNDFASSVFDKLIKHWDGQKYRRYDHFDLTYSPCFWQVINQLQINGVDVWDDFSYRKNGITKTTTDANASVSMAIPADAWQFNFIYRSDSQGGNRTASISQGNGLVEVFNGTAWVEANGFVFSSLEPAATATKGNTTYQKRLKMRCKNKNGGINSIGTAKTITISKGNDATRFNVVGFEWSPREFMLTVINSARGSHQWGMGGYDLANYQDNDIWQFKPDLLLAEISIINWSASEPSALSVDPLFYVNAAKRGYFNEFNDYSKSLYVTSNQYTKCDVIFYSDTLAATGALAGAWDSDTHEPKFGTVTAAATNGGTVSNENVGRVKTNFENYEAVERYVASKDFLFIPVLSTFKAVADKYYGNYWNAMQPSDKAGDTLSYDGAHFNDNGAALLSSIVASVFDQL